MIPKIFKKSVCDSRKKESIDTPAVEISENGVLSVTTKQILKNDAIREQYELLDNPEYLKLFKA